MAIYDLPAHINKALNVSGAAKLSYIGHSQGTVQAFAGFVLNPALSRKVNSFSALAPVAWIAHTQSWLIRIIADIGIDRLIQILG